MRYFMYVLICAGVVALYIVIGVVLAFLVLRIFCQKRKKRNQTFDEFIRQPLLELNWLFRHKRLRSYQAFASKHLSPVKILPWLIFAWPIALVPLVLPEPLVVTILGVFFVRYMKKIYRWTTQELIFPSIRGRFQSHQVKSATTEGVQGISGIERGRRLDKSWISRRSPCTRKDPS